MKRLKFPHVDIVDASAGSGKTYTLAKRYIQLLTDPKLKHDETPLKNILAITFTNKATQEMRQRILELLKKIALDSFSNKDEKEDILSSLSVNENKAKEIASKTLDDILKNYNFFQIQTIDSFIRRLLSGCSFNLGLSSYFKIKDEYQLYLDYSINNLIDKAQTNKDILNLFEKFLEYYLFVENKDGWFSKKDILSLMQVLYNYSNIYSGIFIPPNIEIKELQKKKIDTLKLIAKLSHLAPEQTDGRFINSLNSLLTKSKSTLKIDDLPSYFDRQEYPIRKNKDIPKNISTLWDKIKTHLKELCEYESEAIFYPYIKIFDFVLNGLKEITKDEDIVFLEELNNYARYLIDDQSITVAELYYRLATRFRHYLIDEFQDTSRIQWNNLLPMIHEALSTGGSLFYVGDKKQSIYRFRGGDISLFDSTEKDLKDYNTQHTLLSKNYRSQKEIVDFNNRIFSKDNLLRFINQSDDIKKSPYRLNYLDTDKILNVFKDTHQTYRKKNSKGFVKTVCINGTNIDERDAITKDKLSSLIKELKKRFSYRDITILTRENKDVKLFTSWLIEDNVPVESEKTLNIREHPLIKELISFLKFLNSPIDNLFFASFILGNMFQKATGIDKTTIHNFLFNLRSKKWKNIYFYREFRKNFSDIWNNYIENFFKNVGHIPIYELIVSILGKFKVMDNFPEHQGFIMKFLELIKKNEDEYVGLTSFLEFFEEINEKELYITVSHADAVKIMTVHKAKGLEFSVVIIPFLEIDVTIGTGGIGSKKPYVIKRHKNNTLSLTQLKKKYGYFSEKLCNEYKEEYLKALIDELNNLYVAMTRAQYEMYIFIPQKAGSKNNIARILIQDDIYESGNKIAYKDLDKKEDKLQTILNPSQYSDWISILKDEFIGPRELINRDKILKGKALHFILSCIGNLSKRDKEICLKDAKERVQILFPYIKNIDEYINIVRNLIEQDKFKPFFYTKENRLFQEKEVIDSFGNTKRIDRLILTQEEAQIIDYKSSQDDLKAHTEQIKEYKNITKSLFPNLKIRGFLIYLDTLSIKEL